MFLNKEIKKELEWWTQNSSLSNGKSIILNTNQIVIPSDASIKGWGAFFQGQRAGGLESLGETESHKLLSTKGSSVFYLDFRENISISQSNSPQSGQLAYIKNRRNKELQTNNLTQRDMGFFDRPRDQNYSQTFTRKDEYRGRFRIKISEGLQWVETVWSIVILFPSIQRYFKGCAELAGFRKYTCLYP